MSLDAYTDQQSRIDRAFSHGGSCYTAYCEACGRTYFVTSPGHGDYEDGELDSLRAKAQESPDKYIEVPDFSCVDTMAMPTGGKQVVIGCECDPTKALSTFIEGHAEELTTYLREYWSSQHRDASHQLRAAADALRALGWSDMGCAPRDATWIVIEEADGTIHKAHWASDMSGEEQPPFEGWFTGDDNGPFRPVHPIHWRPIEKGERP